MTLCHFVQVFMTLIFYTLFFDKQLELSYAEFHVHPPIVGIPSQVISSLLAVVKRRQEANVKAEHAQPCQTLKARFAFLPFSPC